MSFLKTIINDIESLWKKEEPSIEADLKAAVAAIEPVWKTALGSLALTTVQGLTNYAASNGGAAAAKLAAATIAAGAKNAGVTAANSTINTLIELAVQKIQQGAAEVTAPAATAPITS